MTWKSAANLLSGVIPFSAASVIPFSPGHAPAGHVQTVVGEALNLTSAGVVIDGHWTGVLI
jgi:hypothetical protein